MAEATNSKNASEFLQLLSGSIIISAKVLVLHGIEGSAASLCRSWCIFEEAPFTPKPDISHK